MSNRPQRRATLSDTGTVTVACKMPNGVYLQLYKMVDSQELVAVGVYRQIKKAEPVGERVKLNGFARDPLNLPSHRVIGGYGLTDGVPADFFNEWLKQNQDSDLVKNHLVMAYDYSEDAAAAAKDHRTILSNMEPMLQNKDPRQPKSLLPNLKEIGAAEKDA